MEKEKRLGGCLKGFVGFILLVVIGLVVLTGVTIQKLTADHHDLKVAWDDADYQSGMDKAKTVVKGDIINLNLLNMYNGAYETGGNVSVDSTFTSSELSAILSKANEGAGPVRNIQIKFSGSNQFEFYCVTDKSIMSILNKHMGLSEDKNAFLVKWMGKILRNKPVYGKGSFELVSPNYVNIDIDTAMIGKTSFKEDTVLLLETELKNLINKVATKENGITIEQLTVKAGDLQFKGTLPAEIKGK